MANGKQGKRQPYGPVAGKKSKTQMAQARGNANGAWAQQHSKKPVTLPSVQWVQTKDTAES